MKHWLVTAVLSLVSMSGIGMSGSVTAHENHTSPMQHKPIVIGHRGASGYAPEHTLTSYFVAVQQGADFIEPDLVSTKDGMLVARHENEIGGTTDVTEHSEFASRKTTKVVDGISVTGWFTEDFTLAELKTLRARERLPELRSENTRFDGQFEIPTFDEILSLVHQLNEQRTIAAVKRRLPRPKPIGVYPETKHPTYFASIGLPLEESMLRTLDWWGYRGRNAPVFIQSFEVGNLKQLRHKTQLQLIQLVDASGAPYDLVKTGNATTYADMIKPAGLAQIAQYADGVGVDKSLVIPRNADNTLGTPTSLVGDAHAQGLLVHAWTFRAESYFESAEYRLGNAPSDLGNLQGEVLKFLATGLDGFFTDHPFLGVDARNQFVLSH